MFLIICVGIIELYMKKNFLLYVYVAHMYIHHPTQLLLIFSLKTHALVEWISKDKKWFYTWTLFYYRRYIYMQQYNVINSLIILYQYIDTYLYSSFDYNTLIIYMYWLNLFNLYISYVVNNALYNIEVEK